MARHIIDHARHSANSRTRLARYAMIERLGKPSRATLALQKAPHELNQSARARAYSRIARGLEA